MFVCELYSGVKYSAGEILSYREYNLWCEMDEEK